MVSPTLSSNQSYSVSKDTGESSSASNSETSGFAQVSGTHSEEYDHGMRPSKEEFLKVAKNQILQVHPDSVVTTRSKFLDVSDGDLVAFCKQLLGEQNTDSDETSREVNRVYSLGQAICSAKNSALKLSLEQDFEYFTRAAEGLDMPARLESMPDEEISVREERFMMNMLLVLFKNHYTILTQEEWDAASGEDFLLTLPVNVKWTAMDDSMLHQTVWKLYPEMQDIYPEELRSRILILHRGVSSSQMIGKYYAQKVELLINFLLIQPLLRGLVWILTTLRILRSTKNVSGTGSFYMRQALSESDKRSQSSTDMDDDVRKSASDLVRIERRTFDHIFPDAKSVLKQLFKTINLQEACWRDVIVVYRANESINSKGEFSLRSTMKYDTLCRNIVLKRFSSIPIADMELVFPEKNVHFAPTVLVNIAVTIIGALVTLIATIRGGLSLTRAWTALTVLATRLGQVYQTSSSQKIEIEQSIGKIVSSRQVASQNAALSSIINDMFSQLTRQIFLAYCVLLRHPGVTLKKLDKICEDILEEKFELCIDFTCEQAVEILQRWGIVSQSPEQHLTSVPITEAIKKLEEVLIVTSSQQDATFVDSLADLGLRVGSVFKDTGKYGLGAIEGVAKRVPLSFPSIKTTTAPTVFRRLFHKKKQKEQS